MTGLRCALPTSISVTFLFAAAASAQFTFDEQGPQGIASEFEIGRGVCCEMDGIHGLDLVAVSYDSLVIGLNGGTGEFGGYDEVLFSAELVAADCGDWDGDERMDVLAVGIGAATNKVFLARQIAPGDWSETSSRVFDGTPTSIVTRDFNGDGRVDFAVGDSADETVEVFLNDGSGNLALLTPVSYSMGDCYAITSCDIDADGDQDILVVNNTENTIRIRRNNGDGTFGFASGFGVGAGPTDIKCGDLNGDGYPDVAVCNYDGNTVSMWRSNGAGGLAPLATVPAGTAPIALAVDDFDCDGDVDVIVANHLTGTNEALSALANNSNAGWTTVENFETFTTVAVFHLNSCEFDNQPGTDLLTFEHAGGFTVVRPFFNIGALCGQCIAPPAGTVAWYTGDICTPEELTGNYDGAYVGIGFCPAYSKVGGGAMGFNDSPAAYVTIDGACALDASDGDMTLCAWVRTRSAATTSAIASKGAAPGYTLDIYHGHARLIVCDSSQCWNTSGSSIINDGQWHHLAFTIDHGASSETRLYVDGVREKTSTIASLGTVASSHPLLLGAEPSPSPSTFFDGALDEVQVFSRALSVGEIQRIYLSGLAGQCRTPCDPVVELDSPDMVELTAGMEDDFAAPGEPTSPGVVLASSCAGSVDFDVVPSGGSVCHTFTGLPDYIEGATLELRIRAGSADTCDDTISLQATGGAPAFLWSRRLGAPGAGLCAGDGGLLACDWNAPQTHTFCLDLNQLPEIAAAPTSIITNMNATDRLDVRVEGDSAVDYMRLRLATDPCPGDLSGDGSIDTTDLFQLLAHWGPCPPPCPPCPYDVNNDCNVDTSDLFLLLAAWGPC